jgi:hypothetical protein
MKKENEEEPPEKKIKIAPCRACLGILQEEFMEATLQKVQETLTDCGYDADHFTVAISLPVSLAIRSHSMNLFLSDKIGDTFDEDDVVPIKQVISC